MNENDSYIPIQSYHHLEFEAVPEGEDNDRYALEKIKDILIAEMNPKLSRAIVFLNNRSKCEQYAEELGEEFEKAGRQDLPVGFYHAGMPSELRLKTEEEFRDGEKVVIFATKAFGMGIDIPNIHFAFHQRPPSTLENYLQEIGRAGRNAASLSKAGREKARCVLFYNEEEFAAMRDKMLRNRLHWNDVEAMRLAIERYQQQQAEQKADRSVSYIVPADLIKQSNALKDKKNPENTQRMLLYWLEKLGHIELGDRVISHLNLSLGEKGLQASPPNSPWSRLHQIIQEKGGTEEKPASILIPEIQTCLQMHDRNQVFRVLFEGHNKGFIRFHRHLRIKMTKFGQEQMEQEANKEVERQIDLVFVRAHQFLWQWSGEWTNGERISQYQIKTRLQTLLQSNTSNPAAEENRLRKSWPHIVRLLNRLQGIRVKSEFEDGRPVMHHIKIKSLAWREQLQQVGEVCSNILPLIDEKHKQQQTVNLADLMKVGTIENPDILKAALQWLQGLGYIKYEQDFVPTSLDLGITDNCEFPISPEPIEGSSDRQVKKEFDNYYLLQEWRLNALEALTEIDGEEQRRIFVREYFACKDLAEIQDLILNGLPGNSRLVEKLRQESLKEEIDALNERQKEIVRACYGKSLIVAAGPGTGKTRTLLLCVADLIANQRENPADILVLAYNNAVVAELRSRLSRLLRDLGYASSYNSLPIYTFHGYVRRTLGDRLSKDFDLENYVAEYLKIVKTNKSLLRPGNRDAPHYIFIDEYQDITRERYQMLLQVKGDNTRLIAIGDDDQSIYGYQRPKAGDRMSSRRYFEKFQQEFQAEQKTLTINYRSGSKILKKAEAYIKRNNNRWRQDPLQAWPRNGTGLFRADEKKSDSSTQNLLEPIANILRTPDIFSVAILFRTNAELYAAFGDIQEKFQNEAQIRIRGEGERFAELREIAVVLDKLEREPERSIGSFGGFESYIREGGDYFLAKSNRSWSESAYLLLYAAAWSFEDSFARSTPVSQFIEQIKDFRDTSELTFMEKERQQQARATDKKTHITLSTIHRVKGLEFDAVLIPAADCTQNLIGQEEIEEERRIRYVAMTRARDYLHLIVGDREVRLFNKQNVTKKENPHTGLKFDSVRMLTLFKFAQDEYARKHTDIARTQGTGEGLQSLILWQIGEGDRLELVWEPGEPRQKKEGYYHLYHPRLKTNIGRVTPSKSQDYIRSWFQKRGFTNHNRLQGIRVTNVSRYRVPAEGQEGSKYNHNLCCSVEQQGYYYIVNCAGYLRPAASRFSHLRF